MVLINSEFTIRKGDFEICPSQIFLTPTELDITFQRLVSRVLGRNGLSQFSINANDIFLFTENYGWR